MRKGYTILEMIGMLAFLVLLFSLTFKPTQTLIAEVPRQNRDFQTAASLNHMFNSLKTDIEAAKELNTTDDPNTLILVGSTKTVMYHFNDQQVYCTIGSNPNAANLWTLPSARLAWEVKNQNTLVITGWLEKTVLGKTQIKFHNSHVFYVKRFQPGENP